MAEGVKVIYSHSILNDARKCLRYFHLKHVARVVVPTAISGDMEFGSALHLGLNDLLSGGNGIDIFNTYWDPLQSQDVQYTKFDWASLQSQGRTFLSRFERLHKKHFTPTRMEERLGVDIGCGRFEGTPDFVGIYKGELSVLDFKTSGYAYEKEKILCEEQLSLYAELEHRTYGTRIAKKCYFVFKKDFRDPGIQVLASSLGSTAGRWGEAVSFCKDLATRTEFHKNPSSCVMGKNKCPYFANCWGSA